MAYKTTHDLLPRSTLEVLHEPVVDPRDGHGARSAHDLIILRKWKAAREGDDEALMDLVKHIAREDLAKLKGARKQRQWRRIGAAVKIRSSIPVMVLLGMIQVEVVEVPAERDGHAMVTSRKAVTFTEWFANYAFERSGVDPRAVDEAKTWLANGGIQRPRRGEPHD